MNDFKGMSERYKKQMLDLYNKYPQANNDVQNIQDNTSNLPPIEDTPPQDIQYSIPSEDTATIEDATPKDELPIDDIPLEEKYPPPELPDYIYQANHPQQASLEDTPNTIYTPTESNPYTDVGYLKVVTTSANQTIPIENVSVIITRADANADQHNIVYSLVTNESGETSTVELPAPAKSLSQSPNSTSATPYAIYNISTYASGYYQVVNSSVPIFSGVKSIQRVNMIPLPSNTNERKTITIPEYEPNL